MPKSELGAELIRPPRRLLPLLLAIEIPLTLLELAAVILPVALFFPGSGQHHQLLIGAAVLLLTWGGAAAWWLRPLLVGVPRERSLTVYKLCQRLPGRLLVLRMMGWAGLALLAALTLRPPHSPGVLHLAALASICITHSFGTAAIRWAVQQRLLRRAITEMRIEPSWHWLQADTLLARLVEVALVLGALAAGFLAVFVPLFVPISHQQFLLLETTFPWTAVALGLLWFLVAAPRQVRPLLAFLRYAAAESPGTEALLRACQLVHRLPSRMAHQKFVFFGACGLVLAAEAHLMLGFSPQQAGLLLGAILIVTTGTSVYELIWSRAVLRPIAAHLLAQPGAAALEQLRAPSLRSKLLVSFGGVLVFTVALPLFWTYLQQGSSRHGFASALLFFAAVLGIALGVVWLTSAELTRPLAALEQRTAEMAQGKLDQRLLPAGEFDEVGRLTAAFEAMRRALLEKIRTIESLNLNLEEKVRQRTAELSRANAELTATIAALKEAQHRLVLSQKLASLGQLVAGIAHEINNPLNAVVNTVEPLAEVVRSLDSGSAAADAESREDLEAMLRVIRSAARRTQRIVQALRSYARQDAESLSPMDLHADLEESIALLQHQLRGVELRRELAAAGSQIRAYRGQLNQAIVNLLSNAAAAVEGRPDGRITIRTRDLGAEVVLEVEDNGPGIPEAVLPRIFDPFFTTKEVGKGTGLGLSITHDIVERHGGRIDVRTGSGGTCFAITVPRGSSS